LPKKNLELREIPIIAINIIFWATWALMVPMLYYVSISSREGQDDYTTIAMLFLFPTVFASISIGLTHPRRTARNLSIYCSLRHGGTAWLYLKPPCFSTKMAIATLGLD
jgi:hypothetical protein